MTDDHGRGPAMSDHAARETLIDLARREHERAVGANALFSVEHWKHGAGPDWPHEPDDDSYTLFENCKHLVCMEARALAALRAAPAPEPTECRGCGTTTAMCLEYKLAGAVACCPDCKHQPEAAPEPPAGVGPPWWCETCESWRHTQPCGRDECPRPIDSVVTDSPQLIASPAPEQEKGWEDIDGENADYVNRVTAVVREADRGFEKVGGSSRHWVRDCFLPILNRAGLRIGPVPDPTCAHGTALDVHCCNCHSGFIFDNDHECPEAAPEPLPADLMAEIRRWSQHTHVGQSEAAALLLRVLAALRDGGDHA